MRFLAILPAAVALYLLVRSVAAKSARSSPEWRKNRVYLPNVLFWVGLLNNVLAVPSVILLWQEDWLGLGFIALSLLGWSMQLAYANCWVRFDEQGFTHHTFFGRTCEFNYNDVTGIRWGDDVRLYCGKHLIFVHSMYVNKGQFLEWVRDRSKQMQNLPNRIRWDPYNDNVPNGMSIFVVLLFLLLFSTAILGVSSWQSFGPGKSEADTRREEVVFVSGEQQGGGVISLVSEDGGKYRIAGYDTLPVKPKTLWTEGTRYTIWCSGKSTVWICQLQAGDQMLLSFVEHNEAFRQNTKKGLLFALILWILTLALFLGALVVGRRPERFSPRVRRWFFRNL